MPRHPNNFKSNTVILACSQGINHYFALLTQAVKCTLLITAGLFFLLLGEAFAESDIQKGHETEDGDLVDIVLSDWDFTLGAGAGVSPDYEGSDDYEIGFLPVVEASWRDDTFFISSDMGIGATLLRSEHFRAGLSINHDGGRDEDDNNALRGLGDVDGGIVGTAFAELDLGQYALGVDITQDLSGNNKGTLAYFSADYRFSVWDDKLMFGLGPEISWASADYTETYFGVNAQQASRSKYNQFDADAGFKDAGLHLNAMYVVDENWALAGGVGYARLLGDAADSPIVKSKNQFFSGLSLSYSF